MVNKKLYALVFVLALILLVSVGMGLWVSSALSQASQNEFFWESKKNANYHIMVILDASDQAYSEAFTKGLMDSAKEYQIAVELIKVDRTNGNQALLDALDMAAYVKVDGIIVHAFNNQTIIDKIQEITKMSIPVITLNEDIASSGRISYVGVNRYAIGQAAGKVLADSIKGSGKIAVIEQKGYDETYSITEDLLLLGIKDVLKADSNLTLELVRYTEQGVLSAETVATEILNEEEGISGIFCTNGQNTLGVVQVLLDKNLIGDIILVGYGNEEEILNFLEKGNIIEASIVTDYEVIGQEAIKVFNDYINTGLASNYVNIDLRVINEATILEYRSEMSKEHEDE